MNKGEFIKAMAEKAGFTNKDAATAYDAFVATITETLKAGDKVQLVGFGSFEVKDVPAKTGINPQTKEKVEIAACKSPCLSSADLSKTSSTLNFLNSLMKKSADMSVVFSFFHRKSETKALKYFFLFPKKSKMKVAESLLLFPKKSLCYF